MSAIWFITLVVLYLMGHGDTIRALDIILLLLLLHQDINTYKLKVFIIDVRGFLSTYLVARKGTTDGSN